MYHYLFQPQKKQVYRGAITIWDTPHLSVLGSQFGYIRNALSNIEDKHDGVGFQLTELTYSNSDEIAYNASINKNHPDIMIHQIGSKNISTQYIMKNATLMEELNSLYTIPALRQSSQKVSVCPFYNIYVLIINKDLFSETGVSLPSKHFTSKSFTEALNQLHQENKTKKRFNSIDMDISKNSFPYIPFLCNAKKTDKKLLSQLISIMQQEKTLGRDSNDTYYDFIHGKTAIYAGTLQDVNRLIRQQKKDTIFSYQVMFYPYENTPTVFLQQPVRYDILVSNNKNKNQFLKSFARYLLSRQNQQDTEILGLLPSVEYSSIQFKKYPYLKNFLYKEENDYYIPGTKSYEKYQFLGEQMINAALSKNK